MARTTENISDITLLDTATEAWFGDVTYRPGGCFGPRLQTGIQFVILHTGTLTITIDGKNHNLPLNHVACMHPGRQETYTFDPARPSRHTWISLAGPSPWPGATRWLEPIPFCLPLTGRMRDLLELGLAMRRTERPGDTPVLRHLGLAFAAAYAQTAASGPAAASTPDAVIKARRFIHEHFARSLDLADLSEAAGVSDNHLVRLFGRHVGETPVRYLWRVRVDRGTELLRETGLTITEIAHRVGFSTPYHFSRLIRHHHGVPPKLLRHRHWGRKSSE